jgi:hypothetical protein
MHLVRCRGCIWHHKRMSAHVASQFSSTQNRSENELATGGRSSETQLVTIGGTGTKRNQNFERLKDDFEVHSDFVAAHPYGAHSDASSRIDERAIVSAIYGQELKTL